MKLELSHDALALTIYDKASTDDKMLLKVRNFIANRFAFFTESKVLLSRDDLNYIEPYLKRISLEPHERIFIQQSYQRLWLKRGLIILLVLLATFVLAYFANKTQQVKNTSEEKLAQELKRYQLLQAEARTISDSLVKSRTGLQATEEVLEITLLELQKKNDTILHAYAHYRLQHDYDVEQMKQQLHLAQSAKLSELAAALPKSEKKYAFQLAAKAWELNPDNQQAIAVLYNIGGKGKRKSKQQTWTIIRTQRKKMGTLSEKDFKKIFSKSNTVTVNQNKKVADQIKEAKFDPAPKALPPIINQQIQQEVQTIQQQIQQKSQEPLPLKELPK